MTDYKTEDLVQWDREHIVHGRYPVGGNCGLVTDRASGIYFYDTDGKKYIDGSSQLISVNLGYGNHEIIDAVNREMNKLQYAMLFHGFSNTAIIECARMLSKVVPPGLDHFCFTSSGSEAIDSAIKISRYYWHAEGSPKFKIISLYDGYHGVTRDALSASASARGAMERGLGAGQPGFIHVPPYYCYRCMLGLEYPGCDIRCARLVEDIILKEGADLVSAFLAEPEMGVGGMVAPPPEYWPLVRDICTRHNVLMIDDEVMAGFCRTGKMFTIEHWGVKPDIMTMAKGITSSYLPLGAVAFSSQIWNGIKGMPIVSHTYAGHPVAAAAATKTIEIYLRDKIADYVRDIGAYALARMKKEFEQLSCVAEVSGMGLMMGIEIVADKATKKLFDPKVGVMQKIQDRAKAKGLWVRVAGFQGSLSDRVCFCPPLIITKKEIDESLDILYSVLAEIKPE
jgi:adenosylmethionine-8-amino-7-oxononanoate aminotransferase